MQPSIKVVLFNPIFKRPAGVIKDCMWESPPGVIEGTPKVGTQQIEEVSHSPLGYGTLCKSRRELSELGVTDDKSSAFRLVDAGVRKLSKILYQLFYAAPVSIKDLQVKKWKCILLVLFFPALC